MANIAINIASSTGSTTSSSTSTLIISAPSNAASIPSPFNMTASASTCSSQPVAAIGYSLDNGATTIVNGASINAQASAPAGAHTLHVKAWNSSETVCTASEGINVNSASTDASSTVPSNAISVSDIQTLSGWRAQADPAAGGDSSGRITLASSPSLSGNARQFNTTFANSSGELYHDSFGDDSSATNFFYDGWVYIANSAGNIANLEFDMNQVM
ncbi:MAG: hypothetical protein ACLGSH_13540 [Acidobacteriota bacterium]